MFSLDSTRSDGLDSICRLCRKEYREKNKSKETLRRKEWGTKHKLEEYSRSKSRVLFPKRQKCCVTNCKDLGQRHHLDYSKPEEILWLCQKHHSKIHLA